MAPTDQDRDTAPAPDCFGELVLGHDRGRTARAASLKLSEVLEAVEVTGKAGKFTQTWDIKPQPGGAVLVTCQTKTTVPEHDAPASVYFLDSDAAGYRLSRNDPNQMTIDDLH